MTFRKGLPGAFVLIKKIHRNTIKEAEVLKSRAIVWRRILGRDLFCRMKEVLKEVSKCDPTHHLHYKVKSSLLFNYRLKLEFLGRRVERQKKQCTS